MEKHQGRWDIFVSCKNYKMIFNNKRIRDELWQHLWVVFAKRPFGSPKSVGERLGRYVYPVKKINIQYPLLLLAIRAY
jgi:hypothetical protein